MMSFLNKKLIICISGIVTLGLILVVASWIFQKISSKDLDVAVKNSKNAAELVSNLLAVDQKHPYSAEVKAQLGIAYIMNGDYKSAMVMLTHAEKIMNLATKKDTRYLIYAGLADANLKENKFAEAEKYSEKAMNLRIDDSLGVIVTMARTEFALGKKDQALKYYQSSRKNFSQYMSDMDYGNVISIFVTREKWSDAVTVYDDKIRTSGYMVGDGLGMSTLYEKDGKYAESLSAAAFELMGLYDAGKLTHPEYDKRLSETLTTVLPKVPESEKKRFAGLLEAYRSIGDGNWSEAANIFSKLNSKAGTCFDKYAFYIALTMSEKKIPLDTLKEFVNLEPYFRTSQAYYYYLWQAMKKGEGSYTYSSISGVLDKTINLGPDTEIAQKTKKEIARLKVLPEKK